MDISGICVHTHGRTKSNSLLSLLKYLFELYSPWKFIFNNFFSLSPTLYFCALIIMRSSNRTNLQMCGSARMRLIVTKTWWDIAAINFAAYFYIIWKINEAISIRAWQCAMQQPLFSLENGKPLSRAITFTCAPAMCFDICLSCSAFYILYSVNVASDCIFRSVTV